MKRKQTTRASNSMGIMKKARKESRPATLDNEAQKGKKKSRERERREKKSRNFQNTKHIPTAIARIQPRPRPLLLRIDNHLPPMLRNGTGFVRMSSHHLRSSICIRSRSRSRNCRRQRRGCSGVGGSQRGRKPTSLVRRQTRHGRMKGCFRLEMGLWM